MSSPSTKIPQLKDLNTIIGKLEEALKMEKSEIIRDSAIKRFELCFDLAWKSIKSYANREGLECLSPRSCLKTAFQLKLIPYDENWLKMLNDRNLTVHIYKEKYAEHVYSRLPQYVDMFKQLAKKLSE
ncbi:MAG: HI0074 family nucleotidyltransferase substrate-binding subunit [Candidatus Aminicenantaceae bacterium]